MKSTYVVISLALVVMILSIVLVAQYTNKNKKERFGSLIKQSGIDGAVYSNPVGMDGAVVF